MEEDKNGRHEAVPSREEVIETDEDTGTPPGVPAKVRTAVYVGSLIFNAASLLIFGLLPVFELLDPGKAAQAMNIIISAINMVSLGLAVGYRPTRSGSPVKP
jgi:hypothetical protein